MSGSVHAIAAARLAAGGSRYTQSRQALVELLGSAGCPLTAEEIVARCGRHRGSVYRNLGVLADSGVVQAIAGYAEFTRYELDEALIGHHHLVCRSCGRAEEVEGPAVERWTSAVAEEFGYTDVNHTVEIFGICSSCAR